MWGRGEVEGKKKRRSQEGGRKCITARQGAKEERLGGREVEGRLQQTVSVESPECHLL